MKVTPEMRDRELALWLHDHPGGTVEDYKRASAPFGAERGGRHRRVHSQYLDWLNTPRVMRVIFGKENPWA